MKKINEEIIRSYFEMNHFLVKILRDEDLEGNGGREKEDMGLIVFNINPSFRVPPRQFVLRDENIPAIPRAMVEVKAWHSKRFSPSVLFASLSSFRMFAESSLQLARKIFKTKDFRKILIVPQLPATKNSRDKSLDIFKRKGIDHILEFRVVLEFLIRKVKVTKDYADSDSLQMIRLLKNYDLLKEDQLNLFGKERDDR